MPRANRNDNGNGRLVRPNRNPVNFNPPPPPSLVTANLIFQLESTDWNGIAANWIDHNGNGKYLVNNGCTKSGNFVLFQPDSGPNPIGTYFEAQSNSAPLNFGTNNVSTSVWANFNSLPYTQSRLVCAPDNGSNGFYMLFGSDDNVSCLVADENGNQTYSPIPTTINLAAWNLWTMTSDRITNLVYLYKNGILVGSGNVGGNLDSNVFSPDGWRLGTTTEGFTQNSTDALVGQFLVYDKKLSDAEVLQNYNATKSTYGL